MKIKGFLAAAVLVFVLFGCGNTKLADVFDEDTVKESAREAVGFLIEGEYDKAVEMMDSVMKEALTSETLGANMEAIMPRQEPFRNIKA